LLSPAISGVAYDGVRGVAGAVGRGGDVVLGAAESLARGSDTAAKAPTVALPLGLRAVMNGIVGDRLAEMGNPVALPMSIEAHGAACVRRWRGTLSGARVLFVHGLCMNDGHWQESEGGDACFGERLVRECGHRPVYLRYNSGLAIAENGRRLAALLEARHRGRHAWRGTLHVVAHSLGGLLVRSAIAEGVALGHCWPDRLEHVVCLGTPHDGAPLERIGKVFDAALTLSRFSSPWAVIGKIRSVAIHQLGDAEIAPWTGRPERLELHAVAGSLAPASGGRLPALVGDGLVPVASALGEGGSSSAVGIDHRAVISGVGHLGLVRHREVSDYLLRVLA
jgi:hypothetical protein